jgi:DNA-binding NarL/FixJ family response regulator
VELEVRVNGQKRQRSLRRVKSDFALNPKTFFFFDKTTNTKRFEVKAGRDGKLPAEETISLLAMQCVVRGQTPNDFQVMVAASENLLDSLVPRANKLIQACMATVLPTPVSQRQQEVLRCILQNLSNKEIASQLNIAERTVKFHVSALLQKFHVAGRGGLMQKAGDLLSLERSRTDNGLTQRLAIRSPIAAPLGPVLEPKLLRLTASERRAVNR